MKRILYISFYFPPIGAIASLRAAKMVKYLGRQGYEISVLCASATLMKTPRDASALQDIPPHVKVFRSLYPDPAWLYKLLYGIRLAGVVRWFDRQIFFPGSESLWLPFAMTRLDTMLKNGFQPDLAIVSFGPPAVLKLALDIKRRYRIPYILDWRDEWTNNPELTNSASYARASAREQNLEQKVLQNASGSVYLTTRMRDNFVNRYAWLKDLPHALIPNGFDEEDFSTLKIKNQLNPSEGKSLRIYYSGSFYDRRQPDPLWQALLELIGDQQIPSDGISIQIRGKNQPAFVLGRFFADPILSEVVKFLPFQPYRYNLREMMAADALLLYIPSGRNTDSVLTGKIFEYLRCSKPVLAIIPEKGAAAELLREAGIGFIASDTDHAGIKNQIMRLYRSWSKGDINSLAVDPEFLATYSRSAQAERLAQLIESHELDKHQADLRPDSVNSHHHEVQVE